MEKLIHFLTVFLIVFTTIPAETQPNFKMKAIGTANFLTRPWDLEIGPEGNLWVTERTTGKVVMVDIETSQKWTLLEIGEVHSSASQDGLLGMALHPEINAGQPYVYLSYTVLVNGERNQKIVRYTYTKEGETINLTEPADLITGLPASNDHNSGRLIIGPDLKLYYTIGDQGGNQNSNYCLEVRSQFLPTQEEVDSLNWSNYPGKVLRLNLDGSIPEDNPFLNGVQSHIFSYGHRNAQGIAFSSKGFLYSDEHGPDTDDEVNLLQAGQNYGWPRVVGFLDNQAYDYCNWSSITNCSDVEYDKFNCPDSATFQEESSFLDSNYQEPIFSMFAVTDDYNFNNPICENSWVCRPNVAPSSIAIYESDVVPGWRNSILVSSLKRGRIYRLQLSEDGTQIVSDTSQYFYTANRYRDIVVDSAGESIYLITDSAGRLTSLDNNSVVSNLANPGMILKFTYSPSTSVKDEFRSEVLIYPNPAHDRLSVELEGFDETITSHIFDSRGKMISAELKLDQRLNNIDLKDYKPGIYYLKIQGRTRSEVRKIVVY